MYDREAGSVVDEVQDIDGIVIYVPTDNCGGGSQNVLSAF
jgi:hypothetical protein